jgi:hypothetical protein
MSCDYIPSITSTQNPQYVERCESTSEQDTQEINEPIAHIPQIVTPEVEHTTENVPSNKT